MAEKVRLDKNNSCPECGRDFGRGATHCDRCTIDESVDPLVAATVQAISEGYGNLNAFLKGTVEEARGYAMTDALQVASSLVYSCGKRIQQDDSKTAEKLMTIAKQLDRIADSY